MVSRTGTTGSAGLTTLVVIGASLSLFYFPAAQVDKEYPDEAASTDEQLGCRELAGLSGLEWLASGWTKAVYRATVSGGRRVALKTVNLSGHEMESCLSRQVESPPDHPGAGGPSGAGGPPGAGGPSAGDGPGWGRCYRRTSAKVLRELILLQQLDHPNVIKVLGSCIPESGGPVLIATELGEPLDSVALLQLSWEERLKVALSVASLLHLLAHSPLGSLAAPDLKRQQFVLVDGTLKLADADDLGISEPSCHSHEDCLVPSGKEYDNVYCVSGRCRGHNERLNILRAGEDLVRHVLPQSGPPGLESQVQEILAAYRGENSWDTERILKETESLVRQSR